MNQILSPPETPATAAQADATATVWKPYLIALVLGAIAITLVFFPTAQEMIRVWYVSVAFEHCWLIPPIVGYLVWDRRRELKQLQPRAYVPGALAVFAAGLVWLLGWAANVNFVQQFGYVGMLQGLVLTTLGPTVTRALLFPLAFALFAVPFGEEFVPFLQKITAWLTIGLLNLSGLPFISDGVFISVLTSIPNETHDFEIAEECSGIRYMTAMAATATLFANIGFKSWKRRAILLAIAFIVPILANGFRAFGIIYVAHKSNMKYAVGVDHILYGWVFFGLVMALVIFIGYLFMDKPLDAPAVDVAPLVEREKGLKVDKPFWLGALAASSVAALVSLYAYAGGDDSKAVAPVKLVAPQIEGWDVTDLPTSDWNPVYDGATSSLKQNYINSAGDVVTLYVAYYDHQTAQREMVRYGNGVTGGELQWTWASDIPVKPLKGSPDPQAFQINSALYVRDVYQWYWVNGKILASDSRAKLEGAKARLFLGDPQAAVIIFATERNGKTPASEVLTKFGNDLGPIEAYARTIADAHRRR